MRELSYLIEIESLIWYFISLVILKKGPIFIQNIRCVNQDIEFENKRIWGTSSWTETVKFPAVNPLPWSDPSIYAGGLVIWKHVLKK